MFRLGQGARQECVRAGFRSRRNVGDDVAEWLQPSTSLVTNLMPASLALPLPPERLGRVRRAGAQVPRIPGWLRAVFRLREARGNEIRSQPARR